MEDTELYDEFGNLKYQSESSEDESQDEALGAGVDAYLDDDEEEVIANDQALMEIDEDGPSNAVVLHEDKQYGPPLLLTLLLRLAGALTGGQVLSNSGPGFR